MAAPYDSAAASGGPSRSSRSGTDQRGGVVDDRVAARLGPIEKLASLRYPSQTLLEKGGANERLLTECLVARSDLELQKRVLRSGRGASESDAACRHLTMVTMGTAPPASRLPQQCIAASIARMIANRVGTLG
jgi:hypothetical protein